MQRVGPTSRFSTCRRFKHSLAILVVLRHRATVDLMEIMMEISCRWNERAVSVTFWSRMRLILLISLPIARLKVYSCVFWPRTTETDQYSVIRIILGLIYYTRRRAASIGIHASTFRFACASTLSHSADAFAAAASSAAAAAAAASSAAAAAAAARCGVVVEKSVRCCSRQKGCQPRPAQWQWQEPSVPAVRELTFTSRTFRRLDPRHPEQCKGQCHDVAPHRCKTFAMLVSCKLNAQIDS